MAVRQIAEGHSYVVPFDSLDVMYLGQYVNRPTDTIPLWTKKRMDGEAEYCRVQILAQDDDDDYSESSDIYMCHVCNVHVPKMCSKEHNESQPHSTMKKIYQTILQRLSKHMESDTLNNGEIIDKNLYYCTPCSKLIKKENKEKHESTENHVKAIKDTIIIKEFYKIVKDDLIPGSNLEPRTNAAFKAIDNHEKTNKDLNNHHVDSDDDIVMTEVRPVENLAVPGPSNVNSKVQSTKIENTESFEEYLRAMIKKYNVGVKAPLVHGKDIILLQSSNGNVVKVSKDHFHSYRVLKNSVYCQMCKMWIAQDTKPHEVTENHVVNVFKPVNDKYARMIDKVSSHCVPCNEIVLTDSGHQKLNENHKKNITDTLIKKTGQTFCEDCDIYIDTHNFVAHLNSKKHLNGIMNKNSVLPTENTNTFMCTLCNLTVHKNAVKSHVVTNTHLIKKAQNFSDKNITQKSVTVNTDAAKMNNKNVNSAPVPPKDSEYCDVCDVKLPMGGRKVHEAGKPHRQRLSQLCDNDNKTKGNTVEIDSSSSSSYTENENSATSFNSSTQSVSEGTMDEYYEQLEFADNLENEVRCKICFIYMPYVDSFIIDHMESESHINLATVEKLKYYNKFLYFTETDPTRVICKICCVYIPNSDRNVIEHMEGRKHEEAETGLFEFHSVREDDPGYICECCDIRTTDLIEHINGKSHTMTYLQTRDIDKNVMRRCIYEEESDDFVTLRYKDLYNNLLKHCGIYKLNDTAHFCGVCQIQLGRICEIDHVLGDRHFSKMEELDLI